MDAGFFHDADVVGVVGDALLVGLVVVYFVCVDHCVWVLWVCGSKVTVFCGFCNGSGVVFCLAFWGNCLQNVSFYEKFLSFCLHN